VIIDVPFSEILRVLGKAFREGGRNIRITLILSVGLIVMGGLGGSLSDKFLNHTTPEFKLTQVISISFLIIGFVLGIAIYALQKSKEAVKQEKKIEEVEQKLRDNPQETKAAWELARVKLESYLNRNLSQVRSIFWWTVIVMSCGFALIGMGVYQAINFPDRFNASILTTSSGVLVSFIGGTFLVLYKATMAQAKDYVTILERINAVGMSVQILETINNNAGTLKDQTTADVAKQLLMMYSTNVSQPSTLSRRRQTKPDALGG
jgi:hypothetical protein